MLAAQPYRPELLTRLARLSAHLKEPVQAGRYWLLSDESGEEVDAAVEAFVASCQRTPRLIASQLPRFARDWDVEAYPPAARARIDRYGLAEALAGRRPMRPAKRSGAGLIAALFALAALAA